MARQSNICDRWARWRRQTRARRYLAIYRAYLEELDEQISAERARRAELYRADFRARDATRSAAAAYSDLGAAAGRSSAGEPLQDEPQKPKF